MIICAIGLILLFKPWLFLEIHNKYNAAWQLAMNGKYEKAKEEFERMDKEYYGKSTYSSSIFFGEEFCSVLVYYDKEDYRSAKSWMDSKIMSKLRDRSVYPKLNKKQNEFVWKMVNAIDESYMAHKSEYDEKDRLYEEERTAERKKRRGCGKKAGGSI